jgi:hypothetical protein
MIGMVRDNHTESSGSQLEYMRAIVLHRIVNDALWPTEPGDKEKSYTI